MSKAGTCQSQTPSCERNGNREGGYEANAAKVMAVENTILSASADPAALQSHIATLSDDIQLIAADHMRLSAGYGRDGPAIKFEAFFVSVRDISQMVARSQPWRPRCNIGNTIMAKGTVKFFHTAKQYGFLVPEDNLSDVFFHGDSARGDVRTGDAVHYELDEPGRNGKPRAKNVRLIDGESEREAAVVFGGLNKFLGNTDA